MPRSPTRHARHLERHALILGGGLLVALLVGGAALLAVGQQAAPSAVPTATPTIDPQLIVRPRTIRIAGTLANGLPLDGTLYPAYPGSNTLNLTLPRGSQRRYGGDRIALSATMLGMAMRPVNGTLVARGQRYTGALTLPMFGTYRVKVVVASPGAATAGSVTLTLSLPGVQDVGEGH
jgi:hypothetical protein